MIATHAAVHGSHAHHWRDSRGKESGFSELYTSLHDAYPGFIFADSPSSCRLRCLRSYPSSSFSINSRSSRGICQKKRQNAAILVPSQKRRSQATTRAAWCHYCDGKLARNVLGAAEDVSQRSHHTNRESGLTSACWAVALPVNERQAAIVITASTVMVPAGARAPRTCRLPAAKCRRRGVGRFD